jgi:hypothetical protein
MVFKVELKGRVISTSSLECVKRLLLKGWKLAEPAQWDDFIHALLLNEGVGTSSESGPPQSRVQSPGLPMDSARRKP